MKNENRSLSKVTVMDFLIHTLNRFMLILKCGTPVFFGFNVRPFAC
jgi:hypothetical protein